MKTIVIFLILVVQAACVATSQEICKDTNQQTQKIKRQPLPKSDFVLKSPTDYLKREREDSKTGKIVEYDPRPQIVPVDVKAGKYHLQWIGYDGKVKIIEYQRADAIDAVVSASLSKNTEVQYIYTYKIQVLPSSPAYLTFFIVQNFSATTKPFNIEGKYVGQMSSLIEQFKDGNWVSYGSTYFKKEGTAGSEVKAQILSSALPGLVECRIVGGERTLKGVGEHMPYELESAMGGYNELPRGYTIGPIDKLKTMTTEERAKYLLDLLPKFQEIGWMTAEVRPCYQGVLTRNDLAATLKRAEQDLKAERITSEVYSIIEGLNQ